MSASASDPNGDRVNGILEAELALGTLLFEAGAAGQRIFDSLELLNERLGGPAIHIQVNYESILIALDSGSSARTVLRRYSRKASLNGRLLAAVSRYLNSLPQGTGPKEVISTLLDIRSSVHAYPTWQVVLGFIGFSVILGYFNHADEGGLLIVAISGLVLALVLGWLARLDLGIFLPTLVAAMAVAAAGILLAQAIPTETTLVAMLVPCILLIPGFQMINAGWELVRGHEDLGSSRLFYFIGAVLTISVGVLAVLLIYNPGQGSDGIRVAWPESLIVSSILSALFALCFVPMANSPRDLIVVSVACAFLGRVVRDVAFELGATVPIAVMIACMSLSLLAFVMLRRRSFPAAVVLISASVQFVPGYYYALTLQGMWQVITLGTALPPADVSSLIYNLIQSVFISVAIVLGTLIPLLVFTLHRRWT